MCYIFAAVSRASERGCDLMFFKDVLYWSSSCDSPHLCCDLMVFKDMLYYRLRADNVWEVVI